jgi:hypothetical protein
MAQPLTVIGHSETEEQELEAPDACALVIGQ